MDICILTNNPKVVDRYGEKMKVHFVEGENFAPVLYRTRDFVQQGYKLLTHPLAGSLKPNQTPYKSIIVSGKEGAITLDYPSLNLIESAVETFEKFAKNYPTPSWNGKCDKDFQTIDLSLMEGVLNKNMEVLYCEARVRADIY